MGEHVIGHTIQTSKKLKYQPGEDVCSCFNCTIFTSERPCLSTNGIKDWQIDDPKSACCGGLCRHQPVCVHPDRDECFIGLSDQKQDPLLRVEWHKEAPNVKCVYDLNKINTRAQVSAFNDKFGLNNDVESIYCTQKVKSCPKGMSECSRLLSVGEGGDECRKWFNKQTDQTKDAAIQNYCLRNKTEDCACVNRASDSAYVSMKGLKGINDGCWYVPCSNPSRYLVPSHLVKPECPKNMCNVVFDFLQTGNVNFRNVKHTINCDFDDKSLTPVDLQRRPASSFREYFNTLFEFIKERHLMVIAGIMTGIVLIVMVKVL